MTSIAPTTKDAYQLVHEGALALAQAERYGVRVDLEYCEKRKKQLERESIILNKKILLEPEIKLWKNKYRSKFNLNSDKQLRDILYKELGLKPLKITPKSLGTDNEVGSTDQECLSHIKLPFIDMFLRRKKLKKAWDVINGIERESVNGFIHPNYTLHLVDTYRSSCRDPNLQNVPVRDEFLQGVSRPAFVPRLGNQLLEIDYGGIEVHAACWYHKDETMLSYLEDPEKDMHRDMSAQIYILEDAPQEYWDDKKGGELTRYVGKNRYVFPEFYGSYYVECANNLYGAIDELKLVDAQGRSLKQHLKEKGIRTYKKFENHIKEVEDDFWNRRFSEYGQWKEDWYGKYVRRGYMDTLTGFRISGVLRKNQIINFPVQGVAFQGLLWVFSQLTNIAIDNNWKSRPVMQIHDSIIWDLHPSELEMVAETCYDVMINQLKRHWDFIITPIEIDYELCPVNGHWGQKKKIKLTDIIK